jgi:hypothetical protein
MAAPESPLPILNFRFTITAMKPYVARFLVVMLLLTALVAATSAQRRPQKPAPAKPLSARLLVQGTYEDSFNGTASDGVFEGKLSIKFEAARWLKMDTNEVGNAEFSDLPNAPAASVTGSATYNGVMKGSGPNWSYEANSDFTGALSDADIVLSNPGYANTGDGLKLTMYIKPKLKGKCHLVSIRDNERTTSEDCDNGTITIANPSGIQISANDDPAKSAEQAKLATAELEFIVEPKIGESSEVTGASPVDDAARARRELEKMTGSGPAGEAGVYAWRGAVTSGSKEAGFKITLNGTKEIPSADGTMKSIRKLTFTATIVPGAPR